MKISWPEYLIPPKFSSYEQTQKAKLLHYMLLAAFFGGITFGIVNCINGWFKETVFLFLFSLICLLGLYQSWKKKFHFAGLILCGSLYILLCLLLYNGIGLYDETILAFPIFITFAAFLFDRKGLFVAALLSVVAVFGIYYLQIVGLFESRYPTSENRVYLISALLVFTSLTILVLRDSWESNLKHLRESYNLTLLGWARALEYRDVETAGHTHRVARLCARLGRQLGLTPEDVHGLELGAYLHDIGKMAIPDEILLKPEKLSPEELELMKQHPIRSVEFISEIPYLEPAIKVVYSHHERWDGSGYPEGLKGEEIPFEARIFSVIDNWDALNSDRPYRKAWPSEDVVAYLQGNAGSIFDPEIVEAFLEIIAEDEN